jgi:hypothetical protein
VSLGGIAKRKGVSSRANLLISLKCLWMTMSPLVTKPRQCPSTLSFEEQKEKDQKIIKLRVKGSKWARKKMTSMTRCNSPKAPTRLHFPVITAPHAQTLTPCHLIHLHDLDWLSPGKHPKLKED